MMGPLSFLKYIPTSQIGNALNLPGQDLPFLPARFMLNMGKQVIEPDYPDVPLPFRLMANMPPQKIMGAFGDLIGLPETGYPVPIRAVQGALELLAGDSKKPKLDKLSSTKSKSCSTSNPLGCLSSFFGR